MLDILWSAAFFLFAIALLIVVHEYGHFIVARWCNIKVLRFSVGFGKRLMSYYDRHGTEFTLSLIPLGGYVKMLDEREGPVPESQLHRTFNRQSVSKRIAVLLAGPLFNLLFAVLAYWLIFMTGITQIAPVIGEVAPHSFADKAGVVSGDEIKRINGDAVESWHEVNLALMRHLGSDHELSLSLARPAQTPLINLRVSLQQDPQSPEPPLSLLGIKRFMPSIPLVISKVVPHTPASEYGLKPGDKILAIDELPIQEWQEMSNIVNDKPGEWVQLQLERDEHVLSLPIKVGRRLTVEGSSEGYLGIISIEPQWPDEMIRERRYPFWKAWWPALEKTTEMTGLSLQMLAKLVTGKVSPRHLSGPLGIAQGAGQSASMGVTAYLSFLALISISLGIINLLPIPLLDGGHILYCFIEVVRRRPLSMRAQVVGWQVGLFLLLAMMALAFYNDLSRW